MKLAAAGVAGFLRAPPPNIRVIVLYGDDIGMIRDRSDALIRGAAGSIDDPFQVADLLRDDIDRLPEEAAALSLMGGRRAVRVRDGGDFATVHVRAVLKSHAPALIVVEAGGLTGRSSLRQLADGDPDAVAIGCYPEEGKALETTIRTTLQASGVGVDPDALSWLSGQLGADRASTKAELEKLALFVGPGNRVTIDAAMACIGDVAGLSLDDALFAATEGDVATTDRALELAFAEGATPVGVLRAGLMHLQRLHRARLSMDAARLSAADAVKSVRPPVFYRRVSSFARALALWPTAALSLAIDGVTEAERGCKRTGWPDTVLCRNTILALARRGAVARAGRS
jgi:DNA polymerase III subunit delta